MYGLVERHYLLDEIEVELDRALLELRLLVERISALAELRGSTVATTIRSGRPATVDDLLQAAADDADRSRVLLLLRRLRNEGRGY